MPLPRRLTIVEDKHHVRHNCPDEALVCHIVPLTRLAAEEQDAGADTPCCSSSYIPTSYSTYCSAVYLPARLSNTDVHAISSTTLHLNFRRLRSRGEYDVLTLTPTQSNRAILVVSLTKDSVFVKQYVMPASSSSRSRGDGGGRRGRWGARGRRRGPLASTSWRCCTAAASTAWSP